jgi:hypothetical protein
LGEQPGQRRGCVTEILGALDQGAVHHREPQPSRVPLPIEDGNTTSSSHRADFPLSAGDWWASIPTT